MSIYCRHLWIFVAFTFSGEFLLLCRYKLVDHSQRTNFPLVWCSEAFSDSLEYILKLSLINSSMIMLFDLSEQMEAWLYNFTSAPMAWTFSPHFQVSTGKLDPPNSSRTERLATDIFKFLCLVSCKEAVYMVHSAPRNVGEVWKYVGATLDTILYSTMLTKFNLVNILRYLVIWLLDTWSWAGQWNTMLNRSIRMQILLSNTGISQRHPLNVWTNNYLRS